MPHFWHNVLRPKDFCPKSKNICLKFALFDVDNTFVVVDDDDDDDDDDIDAVDIDDDDAVDDCFLLLVLLFSSFLRFLFNEIKEDDEINAFIL